MNLYIFVCVHFNDDLASSSPPRDHTPEIPLTRRPPYREHRGGPVCKKAPEGWLVYIFRGLPHCCNRDYHLKRKTKDHIAHHPSANTTRRTGRSSCPIHLQEDPALRPGRHLQRQGLQRPGKHRVRHHNNGEHKIHEPDRHGRHQI